MDDPRDRPLITSAEAQYQERRQKLGMALLKIDCDLHLVRFVEMVFEGTRGGHAGSLEISHPKLAQKPFGLCCSVSKVRSVIEKATGQGLIKLAADRTADGRTATSKYQIDWSGVEQILLAPIGQVPVFTRQVGVATEHLGVATKHLPVVSRHPSEGISQTQSISSLEEIHSESDSDSESELEKSSSSEKARIKIPELRELTEGRQRKVISLPLDERMPYGIWNHRAIDVKLLDNFALVDWFRRQLSLPRPIFAANEGELLLAIASGIACLAAPKATSRVAMFKATVSRRIWHQVIAHIPAARAKLDRFLARYPHCLLHPDGMGPEAPPNPKVQP